MITPAQIREKVLSKAQYGYDIDETNAFIKEIEESFTAIYDENKELYRKMEILAKKIEEYREEEDSIKDTLLTAQKAASEVKKKAREKADDLLAESARTVQTTVTDAKEKAEKIVSDAREYAAKLTKEKTEAAGEILSEAKEKAKKETADAKADSSALLEEAKAISEQLISKAKEEKEHYGNLAQSLKAEAEAFKGRLASLYKDQLDRLSDMAHYDEAKSDEKLEEAIEEADQEFEVVSAKAADMQQSIEKPEAPAEKIEEAEEEANEAAEEAEETASEEAQTKELEEAEPAEEAPINEEENETAASADEFVDINTKTADEPTPSEVEYELEETEPEKAAEEAKPEAPEEDEEPADVHSAVAAFSQDNSAPEEKQEHLPFEDFFHVKPEGQYRTNEKISLIPPDEDDDDEEESSKFKGFFKKKKK